MLTLISFTILFSYTAYYLSRVGLLPSHSDTWWLLLAVGALGVVFYLLNKKFNKPVLFLEYWVFSYPYVILLIINF